MAIKTLSAVKLWSGWWLAAVAWSANLLGGFTLVTWYCHGLGISETALYRILHSMTAVAGLTALVALGLSMHYLKLARKHHHTFEDDLMSGRFRFILRGGSLFSLFLFCAILLQGWSNFVLGPCQ